MLWNGNGFGACTRAQVVVQSVVDCFGNEMDARIDHGEMGAAWMGAFEAT
jgi:hypothetical protein